MWLFKKKVEVQSTSMLLAKKAFEDMVDSFKENKDHPCPDYGLKRTLESCSVRAARQALEEHNKDTIGSKPPHLNKLPDNVIFGLNHIIDYDRLKKEGKPIPVGYFEEVIKSAYKDMK